MAIVLELLSHKNKMIRRYRFNKTQITVGRDYHNDLQLDDPYVCPQHLQISQQADLLSLELADFDSINGVSINNQAIHNSPLHANDVIKLGRTRLRVVDTCKAIPATLPLSPLEEKIAWLSSTTLALSLTLVYFLYTLAGNFVTSVVEFKLIAASSKELAQMAVLCTWPLTFALLAKIFKKESHLINQFNLMWLALFLLNGLYLLDKVIVFNTNAPAWIPWLEFLLFSTVIFGFIWFSLFIAFHQPNARLNTTAAMISLAVLMPIGSLGLMNDGEFSTRAKYDATLLPPLYTVSASNSSSHFIRHSAELFTELELALQNEKP
ncbi:MAG: hypothetical protein ACI965_000203 [Paraglaciecola sp.]|jgi:hypothetical protein